MKKRSAPTDRADPEATAAQAGIEKTLHDELMNGLAYAARSLAVIDEEERQRLLGEAELAYQNAIYLSEQSSIPPESPINKQLNQLGAFLTKYRDQQQEGN